MKKLLIAVSAAACALGAFAALEVDSKVTFEEAGYTVNNPLDLANDDAGNAAATSGNGQWYSATPTDVDATVTAYADPAEGKYLNIESTGKPLYRLIHGMTEPNVATATTETMGTVYIDTKVQFTAGDPDMTSDEDGAKLALWVCGNDEDGNPAATTNFMVKAGCFADGTFTSGVYKMTAGVTFEKDAWYRLTVKSYANVGQDTAGKTYQGFVVFVDGVALTPVNYDLPEWVTVPTEEFGAGLLLSMVANDNTLAAVGFSGTGAIDDVTFAAEAQMVTLTWTAGVTSLVYGDWSTNVTEAGSATVPFVAAGAVNATYAQGYMAGTATGALAVGGTYNVVADPVAATVDGTTYATLAEAIAAANGKTVVLNSDVEVSEAGMVVIGATNSVSVTLDLAGKTFADSIGVYEGSTLTITNSTAEVGYVTGALMNMGTMVLVGGKYEAVLSGESYVLNAVESPVPPITTENLEFRQITENDVVYLEVVEKQVQPEPTVITIADANVTLSSESATYTGSSVAPTVTVVVNETTLEEGTDYDVAIPEIVNAGSYEITVTGQGSYAGTVSKTFTVAKAVAELAVTLALDSASYVEGLAFPTVTVANYTSDDYTAVWSPAAITGAGTYTVTVTLNDSVANYTGSATATFTVTAPAPVVTPVTPGSEGATVTAGSVDDAKAAVTITAPTGIDATGYQGLFDKVATDNGNGTFTVTVQLTTDAEAEIKTDADAVVKTVDLTAAAAVAADGTLAPIAAEKLTPGIYYSVEVADNLGFTGGQEGNRVMAGANGTANIPMPNPKALQNANGNARFFRVKANVKDKDNK